MNFIEGLIQNVSEAKIIGFIKEISEFSVLFKEVIWLVIYITAIVGIIFWYIHKRYRSRYRFEKSSRPEFLSDLITKGIEGFSQFTKLFGLYKNSLISISLIVFGVIAYYFLGIKGVFLIFFLDTMLWLKINIMVAQNQINDGLKNNYYISPFIELNSAGKLVIEAVGYITSRKILFLILYPTITIILLLIRVELFSIWALFWIIVYVSKLISLYYETKLMANLPLCVTVEYFSGDKDTHLILYQTTSTDYRFKRIDGEEELIIPATSVKKMYYDYDFELSQLDQIIELETIADIPILRKYDTPPIASKFFDKLFKSPLIPLRANAWYSKAVIYSKKRDYENAERCLKEALILDEKYKSIAENDRDLDDIRNEKWFTELINK